MGSPSSAICKGRAWGSPVLGSSPRIGMQLQRPGLDRVSVQGVKPCQSGGQVSSPARAGALGKGRACRSHSAEETAPGFACVISTAGSVIT